MLMVQCQVCGDVFADSLRLCPSCGNMCGPTPKPFVRSFRRPPVSNTGDASEFSVGTVLSRSFFTFFKHPFVFVGLSFLAEVPVLAVMSVMRNSTAKGLIATLFSFVFGLLVQGAVAHATFEALRGGAARLGNSLSHGMARFVPMILATLSYFIFCVFVVIIGVLMTHLRAGVLVAVPFVLIALSVLWCKWSMFIPACAVERLGPIESMNRSATLTEGCRLKIAGLYTLGFFNVFVVTFVLGFILGYIVGERDTFAVFVIQRFIVDVPVAFILVMTAVMYYEMRNVKEGVSIDSLAAVFD